MARAEPREVAQKLASERYPSARLLLCAGSVVRGEGLASSDLDIVVIFDDVTNAWRESFRFEGWPVEVFAHDSETLAYFARRDHENRRPALTQMIAEALVIPGTTRFSNALQSWARNQLAAGPGRRADQELDEARYFISDTLDDFRDDRSPAVLRAIACRLYPRVCEFVLASRGHWLGSEKNLPRLVARAAPEIGPAIERAFEAFFTSGDRNAVVQVVQAVLEPYGGELFEGYRSDAPAEYRLAPADIPWPADVGG